MKNNQGVVQGTLYGGEVRKRDRSWKYIAHKAGNAIEYVL